MDHARTGQVGRHLNLPYSICPFLKSRLIVKPTQHIIMWLIRAQTELIIPTYSTAEREQFSFPLLSASRR